MTYRQLQAHLKQLRTEGKIPATVKLNQKREVLEAILSEWVASTTTHQRDTRTAIQSSNYAGEVTLLYIEGGEALYGVGFDDAVEKLRSRLHNEGHDYTMVPVTHLGATAGDRHVTSALLYK